MALVLVLAVALSAVPVSAAGKESGKREPGTSQLEGKILASDGKRPVRGAIVRAYHMGLGKTFSSAPSGANGGFRVDGLPFGYFDVAVEAADGFFVATEVISISPSTRRLILLTLKSYEDLPPSWSSTRQPQEFAGSDQSPTGVAVTARKSTSREFWTSTRGVVLLSSLGGAALLAIAVSDEPEASPLFP